MTTAHTDARARRSRLLAVAGVVVSALLLPACSGAVSPPPADDEVTVPAVSRTVAPAGELPADVRSALHAAMTETMTELDVPGAAAGVWVPGEGSWTSATGLADTATNEPVTTDMQWPLRSVTKSYTVTLLLQLVDEGAVSLDDPIDRYVDGVTDGDRITLRQLADMSSGNADYVEEAFVAEFSASPERLFTLDELNGFVLGEPAQFAPGTRRVYTNANTNLLGAVIEKVTGQDFAAVLDDRILRPLAQTGTRYIVDASTWTHPHATGYAPGPDGLAVQPDNLSVFGPAGSMVSTLDDARAWADALGGGAFLTPETQSAREAGAPLESGPPYDLYALGVGQTQGWWGHNGEGFGFTAAVFHDPATGASIAVFANESGAAGKAHPADLMFRRFADVLARSAG